MLTNKLRVTLLALVTVLVTIIMQACGGEIAKNPAATTAPAQEEVVETDEASSENDTQAAGSGIFEGSVDSIDFGWGEPLGVSLMEGHTFPTGEAVSSNDYFIDGFVIIVYPQDLPTDELIALILDKAVVNDLIEIDQIQVERAGGEILTVGLFQFDNTVNPWVVVEAVFEVDQESELGIYTEPDYIINPVAGSKWDWEGSPLNPQPFRASSNPPDYADYANQWAFTASSSGDSSGIELFILDSSPFSNSGEFLLSIAGAQMELIVSHPANSPLSGGSTSNPHGLFAAGMTRPFTRNAHLHLVKVLDDQGFGETFTVLKSLLAILNSSTDPAKTVINLSLGIPPEEVLKREDGAREVVDRLVTHYQQDAPRAELFARYQIAPSDEPIPLIAMHLVIDYLIDNGAVVVAAAGNDSDRPNQTIGMQVPARWNGVQAVGAASPEWSYACYSNDAYLAAPGGAGRPPNDTTLECKPRLDQCAAGDPAACRYGVISVMLDQNDASLFQFGHWVGTSFATPWISGEAASLLNNSSMSNSDVANTLSTNFAAP